MIHINIGSNLESIHGSKMDNISIAINLLQEAKVRILKISNFYETPSYPNTNFPKFIKRLKSFGILFLLDLKHVYNLLYKFHL